MTYSIRSATPMDLPGIEELLPRLADFDVPSYRLPEHLWHGDREVVHEWARGHRADMEVIVAIAENSVVGVVVLSLRKELLSGEPSAHIEVLAVSNSVEGAGIGSALMREIETVAVSKGVSSLSLHVFSNNERARALYERQGFNGELMRYFKPLGDADGLPTKSDAVEES